MMSFLFISCYELNFISSVLGDNVLSYSDTTTKWCVESEEIMNLQNDNTALDYIILDTCILTLHT